MQARRTVVGGGAGVVAVGGGRGRREGKGKPRRACLPLPPSGFYPRRAPLLIITMATPTPPRHHRDRLLLSSAPRLSRSAPALALPCELCAPVCRPPASSQRLPLFLPAF